MLNDAVGHNDMAQTMPPEATGNEAVGLSTALARATMDNKKESKVAIKSFIFVVGIKKEKKERKKKE